VTKEELIEAIGSMTVLELADLIKALEEKFGVSAAAPVAVAMPGVGGAGAAVAPEEEEQTEFDVLLTAIGDQKIKVIKAVRELTALGLREAKAVVDASADGPSEVVKGTTKEAAAAAKEKLEAAGATVEIK